MKFLKIPKSNIDEVKKSVTLIGKSSFGTDTASFLSSIEDINRTAYELFTVSENDNITGFVILSVVGIEAEILQIAVERSLRKKGTGTFILENVFEWCRLNGVKKMYLEVRRSNKSAVELYKKTGFEVVGNRKSYYDNPIEDALIMTRRICSGK